MATPNGMERPSPGGDRPQLEKGAPPHAGNGVQPPPSNTATAGNRRLQQSGRVDEEAATAGSGPAAAATGCRGRQHLAALLAHGWSACGGAALAWTSPALPVLMGHRGHADASVGARMSLEEASVVAALLPLGALLAGLAARDAARALGRRGALRALAPPTLAAWMLVAWADRQALLIHGGRFLVGVSWGLATTLVSMYCSEIADAASRARLQAYAYPAAVAGHVWVCALGTALPFAWYTTACALLPMGCLAALCWLPESPVHLAEAGRHEEAWEAVRWLRGGGPGFDARRDLETTLAALGEAGEKKPTFSWRALAEPATAKAFALCLGLQFFQLTCGVNAFVFYTTQVFEGVGTSPAGNESSVILTVVYLVAAVLSTHWAGRMRRRPFLIASSVGMALGQGGFGLYSYFYRAGYDVAAWAWTPVLSIAVFYVGHAVGFGSLLAPVMGELLPAHSKVWALPTIAFFARLVAVTLAKEVPIFIAYSGHHVVFGMFFGSFSALAGFFVLFFLPETNIRRTTGT